MDLGDQIDPCPATPTISDARDRRLRKYNASSGYRML